MTQQPALESDIRSRRRRIALVFISIVLAALLVAAVALAMSPPVARMVQRALPRIHQDLLVLTLLHPIFYIGAAFILLVERLYPARRDQPVFSVGLAQDLVWVFFESMLRVAVLVTYASLLRVLIRSKLGFLLIDPLVQIPEWARFVIAILVIDFLAFFHHWVRHRIPVLWLFHSVHHSQRELNLFTDLRYHALEYAVAHTVRLLPLLMLGVSNPPIFAYAMAHTWYTRFCHANIRTNLGPLRFILITPQSHRVHHSIHRRHWDKNFGVIFSVWDRLFGSYYKGESEYPRSGIPDADFPHEFSARPAYLLITPIQQLVYPFAALWRRWFNPPGPTIHPRPSSAEWAHRFSLESVRQVETAGRLPIQPLNPRPEPCPIPPEPV